MGQCIVGRDIEVETARGLASQAALDALAVAAQAVGTLDRVRIVQMLVLVASTPERRAGPARRVDTDSRYGLASAARTSARCRPKVRRGCGPGRERRAEHGQQQSRGVGQYVPGVGEQRQRTGQQAADHLGDEDRPGDGQHDQQRLRCRPVAVIPWECQCPCECPCPEPMR